MRVGIAIDAWKLGIFQRHLTRAGHPFAVNRGMKGTLLLIVDSASTSMDETLLAAIKAANDEAKLTSPEHN